MSRVTIVKPIHAATWLKANEAIHMTATKIRIALRCFMCL